MEAPKTICWQKQTNKQTNKLKKKKQKHKHTQKQQQQQQTKTNKKPHTFLPGVYVFAIVKFNCSNHRVPIKVGRQKKSSTEKQYMLKV